ncbi:endonuclease/exonuclease/phosphatase family protein [Cellulomonas septica]|uniref:endonuclease/exonuclease/phosphatase family protein n=1 Tax=Cellulomonas septica TaxID=285080 RepID=UPI0031B61A85
MLDRLLAEAPRDRRALVAVDGAGGSGKSTVTGLLAAHVPGRPVVVLHADDFFHPAHVRHARGRHSPAGFWLDAYDYDALTAQALGPLGPGGDGLFRPAVTHGAHDGAPRPGRVQAAPDALVLVDGTFLHRAELAGFWDWSVYLDVPLDVAGLVLLGASALGAWPLLRPDVWPAAVRVGAAVLLTVGTGVSLWTSGPVALVALAVTQVVAGLVVATVLSTRRPAPPGIPRTAISTGFAGLGVVLPLLLYMLDYDVPLPVDNAWVVVLAAAVVGLAGLRRRTPEVAAQVDDPPLDDEKVPARVNAARLLLIPGVVLALVGVLAGHRGWSTTGATVPAEAADGPLTVVDWNLHYGVSPLTAVDLEGVARTIEAADPDVVTLQEVERGWIFGGGADMATWLAHRLDMTIRFAPAADHQFGNAVLARSGLTDVTVHPLPYGDGPQQRSALSATLTTASGTPVRVTSVHLQHRASNTPTRLDQLDALLAAEPVTGAAILAGDLNAEPGSPELDLLTDAGWVSAVDAAGDPDALTEPSTDPAHRIDWVLGQGVTFTAATVGTSTLSDHLPVVATFTA